MSHPQVIGIYIAGTKGEPTTSVEEVDALAGQGLDGDRYFQGESFEGKRGPDREVTLIESEALEALHRDYQIALEPGSARRNLVTRGVALNHLVGREFRVGSVALRGIRLCEPCDYLESKTKEGIKRGLAHRGGLRAQILSGGRLRVGDAIQSGEAGD